MELIKLTAKELATGYRKGDFSCEEVVKAYVENINRQEETINAYITLTQEYALQQAKELDKKFRQKEELSILAGVPISVKDNIAMKDVRMTCGSRMLENYIPPYDAVVTERVKKQGAIIMGKVNLDEFAMGASTKTSYFGTTKNPLNTELIPGGSSGGSAASVAAEECVLSIGTDTGGSVRHPSSFCATVGMKPTYGSIPRYGIATMANTFDQPGAIGRNVEDVTYLLQAMEGEDRRDATSVGNPDLQSQFDYSENALSYLKGLKVAVPKLYLDMKLEPAVKADFDKTMKLLEQHGAIVESYDIDSLKYVVETYHILVNGEIAPVMARYDGLRFGHKFQGEVTDLEEFYRKTRAEGFGDEVKRRIMIGTHILSLDLAKDYYFKALEVRGLIKRDMEKMFEQYDMMLSPTAPVLPYAITSDMSPVEIYMTDLFTIPANMAGSPSISIPMPKGENGLSVGMEFTAKRFNDKKLIETALGFERSLRA